MRIKIKTVTIKVFTELQIRENSSSLRKTLKQFLLMTIVSSNIVALLWQRSKRSSEKKNCLGKKLNVFITEFKIMLHHGPSNSSSTDDPKANTVHFYYVCMYVSYKS